MSIASPCPRSIKKRLAGRIGLLSLIFALLCAVLVVPPFVSQATVGPAEIRPLPAARVSEGSGDTLPGPVSSFSSAAVRGWWTMLWRQVRGREGQAEGLLRQAVLQSRDAGRYALNIGLDQAVTPEDPFGMRTKEEWAHFDLRGEIAGRGTARFAITPGRTSFALASRAAREILVRDGTAYERVADPAANDRWSEISGVPAMLGLDSDGLTLLAAASDVKLLEPTDGPRMLPMLNLSYRRVGFKLQSGDIIRAMLAQRGALDAQTLAAAQLNGPHISGTGELWIDPAGYPARLLLDMSWMQKEDIPYRVRVHSDAGYSRFGGPFPAERFDPFVSPTTGLPVAELAQLRDLQIGLWLPFALALAGLGWLIVRSLRGDRRAFKALTIILLVALLAPTVSQAAEAAGVNGQARDAAPQAAPRPGSETAQMLRDLRSLRTAADDLGPQDALADEEDEDGDSLPNGYEIQYGTNPYVSDTDFDGISDYDEINGVVCQGQTQQVTIKTNPMNPDSNQDGLLDGEENYRGKCAGGNIMGYAWVDDNDNDLVPDALDLSPFSVSAQDVAYVGGLWQAPNMTFETLDQNPDEGVITPYPFYVELQIRPRELDSLRWAYKIVSWPADDAAAIQNTDPVIRLLKKKLYGIDYGTSGEVKLIPFMQATVRERDLPTPKSMQVYGVSASPHKDANGSPATENGEALWDMAIPLMTVERGGQVFAFQAKMLHDRRGGNNSLTRHWRDVRLKWAAVADVLMLNDQGTPVASPNDGYGLWVYDEAYLITGMQVSRQGGASVLLATTLPTLQPYDDAPIALLRGGMESQFLNGAQDLADVKARFDTPNNATLEQRWGIPQSTQYRVVYNASTANYAHVDAALATTTMTTTMQLLNNEFSAHTTLNPTLLFASEQRSSSVNLDDDPPDDYLDITINTCLKPLITSRSLKLQTYDWVISAGDLFGHWEPMSLDQALEKVAADYAKVTDANYSFYMEELTILKMATTTWQLGVTAIYKIGQQSYLDPRKALTDPEIVQLFLGENGEPLNIYRDVMVKLLGVWDAGGPAVWLQTMWTKTCDTLKQTFAGSYLDMANKTPASYITVTPQGQSPGGEAPPPAQPIDLEYVGYTQLAITMLGLWATYSGNEGLGEVAQVLTRIIEVYQKFRALVEMIKTTVNISEKMGSIVEAAQLAKQLGLVKDLTEIGKQVSLIGLIFAVTVIWIAVLVQYGDLGPSIALTVVVRAI
ncbi:MAG: hypothetical protein QG637_1387, partial [Chloroflexota bacterium]|nr:hypothetical protein [Chloroflexota bacterium]